MTLSKRLREEVCKKLQIHERQLRNRVAEVTNDADITDRDVALLLIAHKQKINITKPRYAVPKDKIEKFNEQLKDKKVPGSQIVVTQPNARKNGKEPQVQFRRLLNFKGKYPEIFYDRLEDEINTAYNNPKLPNAVLMLSRKLIENLVYNLLQYKFKGAGIRIYFDTAHNRPHDFGVLLDNLKDQKHKFDQDLCSDIDKLLEIVNRFRLDANSKIHNIMEYLESTREIKKMKIVEMVQILLKLIDRVK